MSTSPHRIETPNRDRYAARPLFDDDLPVTNAVAISKVVPCAGATTAYLRYNSAVAGSLAVRFRRTDGEEYPVAAGPADAAVVAATYTEATIPLKGIKEFIVRFTPSATGILTYFDVAFA